MALKSQIARSGKTMTQSDVRLRRKRLLAIAASASSALSLIGPKSARAASIAFNAPTTISADTDAITAGSFISAYDESNSAQTINGVSFTAGNSKSALGSSFSMGFGSVNNTAFGSAAGAPFSNLSSAYQNALKGGAYFDGTAVTVTLNSLTSGHQYAIQLWVVDDRATGRTETITSSNGNTQTLDYNSTDANGGVGQFATGIFTANTTTQQLTLNGNQSSQMNAIQLRDVTNIGYWVGTGGATWDASSTNNFASNLYSAALTTTTFATASSPLNAVTFADAYWSSGATTAVTQNAVTIAAGGVSTGNVYFQNSAVNYTITSSDANGINGATAVSVLGNGTVTLLGSDAYTGATTIASGTLQLGNGTTDGFIANTSGILDNASLIYNVASSSSPSYAISGSGSVTKSGSGTLTLSAANSYTGATTINAGTLNYSGSLASGGQFNVGASGGGNAVLGVQSGASITLNNANFLVGNGITNSTGQGFVNQTAGSVSGINQFQIGAGASGSSYGYYNLSGGSIGLKELDLGSFNGAAVGVLDMSGGTMNVSNWIVPARGGSGSTGILNMTGGTLNYAGGNSFEANWGNGSTGNQMTVINIANASLLAQTANINLMASGGSTNLGEINLLSGGLLQATSIAPGSGTGTSDVNFNGGTLKANTATTTFLTSAVTAANVYSGGGTIDNNGVNITIPIALAAPVGSGANANPTVTNGGSGYLGAPAVKVSGTGGVGASAYATVSGGAVTGIVVTSPGTGYTGPLSFSLTGGGGTGATIGTVTQTANTSGGMTFQGIGTTTLSGASTYSGATTVVSGGTIRVNGSLASGSAVTVAAGALNYGGGRLGGTGTVGGTVALSSATTATQGGMITAGINDSTTGTLTTGSETWNAGAAYQWKIASLLGPSSTVNAAPGSGGSGTPGSTSSWDDVAMSGLTVSSGGSSQPFTIALHNTATLTTASGTSTYSWIIAQSTALPTLPGTSAGALTTTSGTKTGNLLATTPSGSGSDVFALDTSGFGSGFVVNGGAPAGTFSLEFVNVSGTYDLDLDYNAAPEPGAAMLILGGALPMLSLRRRRAKQIPRTS